MPEIDKKAIAARDGVHGGVLRRQTGECREVVARQHVVLIFSLVLDVVDRVRVLGQRADDFEFKLARAQDLNPEPGVAFWGAEVARSSSACRIAGHERNCSAPL